MRMLDAFASLTLLLALFGFSGCGAITADMMPKAKYYTEEAAQDLQSGQVKGLKIVSRHWLLAESAGYHGGLFYLINEWFLPLTMRYFSISFSLYGETDCKVVDLLKNALNDHKLGEWKISNNWSDVCRRIYEAGQFDELHDKSLAYFWHETDGLQEIEIIRKVETIGLQAKPDLSIQIRIRTTDGKALLDFVLQALHLDLSPSSLKTYNQAFVTKASQ